MRNPEPELENETHKLVSDLEIQTDHLVLVSWSVIMNKKREPAEWWTLPFQKDHWVKMKENEKRDKYVDLARKLNKKEA